jgi:hypothetical protein
MLALNHQNTLEMAQGHISLSETQQYEQRNFREREKRGETN